MKRDVEADRLASHLFRRPKYERLRRAAYHVLRAGGNALEYVPEPIRPKIRHRDRAGEPDSG